jgi:hypothetical protein
MSSSENSSGRTLAIVIVVVLIVTFGFIIPLPSFDSIFQEESYYNETIEIIIQFPEVTEFSILLPIILAGTDITPALEDINLDNDKISFKTVNSSSYIEINDTSAQFGMDITAFKPEISGSRIAYESFLFDHSFETDGNDTVSIYLYANISATVTYTLEGKTNLCNSDPQSQTFYLLEIQPGRNVFVADQLSFAYVCA